MKILVIEDQEDKSRDIEQFCELFFKRIDFIHFRRSLRSGLKAALSDVKYDLIFLDMSMPNFDPSEDDPLGGTPESFAGKELLAQLKFRKVSIPVVIVTQYQTFNEGKVDLKSLNNELMKEYFGFYMGIVYYSSADKDWQTNLKKVLIENLKDDENFHFNH